MGGDAIGTDLVHYSTGVDFVKALIQVACENEPDLRPDRNGIAVESKFILTEDDLVEFDYIKRESPERILRIVDDKHLDRVGQTTNSSDRAGCYILKV